MRLSKEENMFIRKVQGQGNTMILCLFEFLGHY